jgi:hypothetical protein
MELTPLTQVLEALSYLVTILGVPGAVYLFWNELRQQRRARESEAYNTLAEKYGEYIKLCLDRPELDTFEWSASEHAEDADIRRERMMMTYLMTLFERAYFMYRDQSPAFRRRQWAGWEEYIDEWCTRPAFRRAWELYGRMFDTDFIAYLSGRVRLAAANARGGPPPAPPGAPASLASRGSPGDPPSRSEDVLAPEAGTGRATEGEPEG